MPYARLVTCPTCTCLSEVEGGSCGNTSVAGTRSLLAARQPSLGLALAWQPGNHPIVSLDTPSAALPVGVWEAQ